MLKKIAAWLRPRKAEARSIAIPLDPNHRMVKLEGALDWEKLTAIAEDRRTETRKYLSGPTPKYRQLLGATVVRCLESCTLRKATDLVQNYGPARVLCGLADSDWTPNFRTLSDFEIMLGGDGLAEISKYVVGIAVLIGFADVRGLCSDTTAQEAQIPYPNEVGLMGAFARSAAEALGTLGRKAASFRDKATDTIDAIKAFVRKYRLFAKDKADRKKIEKELLAKSKRLARVIRIGLASLSDRARRTLRGHQKRAYGRLGDLLATMQKLTPQMEYYFDKGKVAKGKIVTLFLDGVRSIVRGKAGKKVEFGLKWGINQIRGGYISIFRLEKNAADADFAVEAVKRHVRQFGKAPTEFGFDRGGWSKEHLDEIKGAGVKRVAVAPKGRAKWLVTERCKGRMVRERAQVEGKIGTMKAQGFNRPPAKTTAGMERSAFRAELRYNMTKLLKDCAARQAGEMKKRA